MFFLFLVIPLGAVAQQVGQTPTVPTVPSLAPQAVTVLTNALNAMGGQALAGIQDSVIQVTSTPPANLNGTPGTATIKTKGAYLVRTDGVSGSKNASVIFNNGREFRQLGQGWVKAPAANAYQKRLEHLPALMLAYEIVRSDLSATYIGQETIASRAVYHVRLARVSQRGDGLDATFTTNSQLDVYVDTQTYLITKISFLYLFENDWRRGLPMEIYYDQYQTIDGLAVPFHQRYVFNGQPASELQITSATFNQGLADSLFGAN
jgi:hypothetical protein